MEKFFSDIKAISLKTLNYIMLLMAVALSCFLLYVAWISFSNYNVMFDSTQKYIKSQRYAADLLAGSDYLTEQVLAFAVTGNKVYADHYFKEADENKRRDRALTSLEVQSGHNNAYAHLQKALDRSNMLMNREFRSMRLVIEASGQDASLYPAVLRDLVLDRHDRQLSDAEKLALARELLVDAEYSRVKEKIRSEVSQCIDVLIRETRTSQEESAGILHRVMTFQFVLMGSLIALAFMFAAVTSAFVVRPLRRGTELMFSQRELPEDGAYELKCFARIYNRLFRQNKEHHRRLAYEAEHDPLTGLYNRSSFDRLRSTHEKRSIALLLVDVDRFKTINDTYGHDTGDRILKKVAFKLLSSFREEDFVFRIGGDEFAVIMVYARPELKPVVERKIRDCNDFLMSPEDGLPEVSLSVGVAFSGCGGGSGSIYKDADTALYQVKARGRNGVAFFGDDQQRAGDAAPAACKG